jgi:hypothetical protein
MQFQSPFDLYILEDRGENPCVGKVQLIRQELQGEGCIL